MDIILTEEMKIVFHNLHNNGTGNIQDTIVALKKVGYTEMQIAYLLFSEVDHPFEEAKLLVLNSKTCNE